MISAIIRTICVIFISYAEISFAQWGDEQSFVPKAVLEDSSISNSAYQWREIIEEKPIVRVEASVKKASHNKDVFLVLRFGRGQTLANGKKIYLENNSEQTISWEELNEFPKGEPLVISAYNGEVLLHSVKITYSNIEQKKWLNNSEVLQNEPKNNRTNDIWGTNNQDSIQENPDELIGQTEKTAEESCKDFHGTRKPRIDIDSIRTNPYYLADKFRVSGSIFAACVDSAAYYEMGQIREVINFPLDAKARRIDFSIEVTFRKNAEIRVSTIDGRQDLVDLDREIIRKYPRAYFRLY